MKEKEFINGVTDDITEVNGKIIKCMELVLIIGMMVVCTRVHTLMIKNKDKEHSFGLMDADTLENGIMGNSMV